MYKTVDPSVTGGKGQKGSTNNKFVLLLKKDKKNKDNNVM